MWSISVRKPDNAPQVAVPNTTVFNGLRSTNDNSQRTLARNRCMWPCFVVFNRIFYLCKSTIRGARASLWRLLTRTVIGPTNRSRDTLTDIPACSRTCKGFIDSAPFHAAAAAVAVGAVRACQRFLPRQRQNRCLTTVPV